jgi:lipopolysaccharide transport system ATP-binding protein
MSDVILSVENVSKLYRLGTVGTGTFGGDVQRFWKTKILGQEDPFLKIGQTNDRTSKEKAEFVWALQDINFEVKRGEVLGIIGKNGAGKSTLLKLLSRITSPTTGSIKSAGRMASLLEVGTGFHPELTGRENIFLNGAILGMTKKEIQSKFDEIVDFSGCELYIDTPTKRYSSGMTVRLGFAVAAFLDPEILVVDEVLAVGDAEFQKKAIGKMKEVSRGEGRAVLFVSHNMDSIKQLCPKSILIENGKISMINETNEVIENYTKSEYNQKLRIEAHESEIKNNGGFEVGGVKINYVKLLGNNREYDTSLPIQGIIKFNCLKEIEELRLWGGILDTNKKFVGMFYSDIVVELEVNGTYLCRFEVKNHCLTKGKYSLTLCLGKGKYTNKLIDYAIASDVVDFLIISQNGNEIPFWRQHWGSRWFDLNTITLKKND